MGFQEIRKQLIDQVRPIWGSDSIAERDALSNAAVSAGLPDKFSECIHGSGSAAECYRKVAKEVGLKKKYKSLWRGGSV